MAKNKIILKGYVDNFEELIANAAIMPGMLIERMSTGKVRAHNSADNAAHVMIAVEDALQGRAITTAYAADERVQCRHMVSGEQFYGLIANGEDIAIGDKLVSNGDGYLKERGPASGGEEPGSIISTSLEDIDMSGSSGADPSGRCEMEVF